MDFGSGDRHAIARNHHHGIRHRRARRFFRNGVNHNNAACLAVLFERFRGEPLACLRPLHILECDSHAFLPTRIENRRLQRRAPRRVGIAFRGDVKALLLRSGNHLDQLRRVLQPHAGDVNDMQRRASCRSGRNHFLDSRKPRHWFFNSSIAQMDMHRRSVLGGDAEHFHDFRVRRGGGVIHAHSLSQSAAPKSFFHQIRHAGKLFCRCLTVRGVSGRQKRTGIVHHFHAHGDVPDAHAKIDQRLPFPRAVPLVDVVRSCLKFKRSRHSIVRLKLVIPRLLSMLV